MGPLDCPVRHVLERRFPVPLPFVVSPLLLFLPSPVGFRSSSVSFRDLDPAGTLDDFMALLDPHPLGDLVVDPILMDSFGGA